MQNAIHVNKQLTPIDR